MGVLHGFKNLECFFCMEPYTHVGFWVSQAHQAPEYSGIALISDEQQPAAISDEVSRLTIGGAHCVFPLSLVVVGIGREGKCMEWVYRIDLEGVQGTIHERGV